MLNGISIKLGLCVSYCALALLAGCVTAPPTERCARRLMVPAKPIGDVRAGDDINELYADLRRDSGRDKGQIRGLQSCVTAIYGK